MGVTINGQKVKPGGKATQTEVKGKVEKTKKAGKEVLDTSEKEVPVATVLETTPMANVGVSAKMTKNLGNYESITVQVSLHMPSEVDEASLTKTFDFCKDWVDTKMQEVLSDEEE